MKKKTKTDPLFDTPEERAAWERGAKERFRHLVDLTARRMTPEERKRLGYPDPR